MNLPENPLEFQMVINGEDVESSGRDMIIRESPGHEIPVTSITAGTAEDVDAAVAAARQVFDNGSWPSTTGEERARILMNVAMMIRSAREEIAYIETIETGKPIVQTRVEVDWAAGLWDYAAALARQLCGDSSNNLGAEMLGMTLRQAVGVVAVITPCHFPMLILSQKLPFALAAGCTTIIKPSELTSATTLIIADMLEDAGVPHGVVNVVTGYGDPVATRIFEHDDVDMISFTGSTRVGKIISRAAAGHLKKMDLELGGNNSMILFKDADIKTAVDAVRLGAFFNSGQSCVSIGRVLVHESIAEKFVNKLSSAASRLSIGDPLDEKNRLGPVTSKVNFDKILDVLARAKRDGVTVRLGGSEMNLRYGYYVQTTILDNVTPDMAIAKEEISGPILSVIRFKDDNEAIKIANDSNSALAAGVWTANLDKALSVTRQLRAGKVWVNTWMNGPPEFPLGGTNPSGIGNEIGRDAVEVFTDTKNVKLQIGPRTPWW